MPLNWCCTSCGKLVQKAGEGGRENKAGHRTWYRKHFRYHAHKEASEVVKILGSGTEIRPKPTDVGRL